MTSELDAAIAAALDETGVPRAKETESDTTGHTSAVEESGSRRAGEPQRPAQRSEVPALSKAERRKIKETEDKVGRLERRLRKVETERDELKAAAKKAKAAPKVAKPSVPERAPVLLTFRHETSEDLFVRLQGDIVLISLVGSFAVTSAPLSDIPNHEVGVYQAAEVALKSMDEADWILSRIEDCARHWRILHKAPLVRDYVSDNRLAKLVENTHGIKPLHEAYLSAQEGLKGVGPKSVQTLKTAYERYSKDIANLAKEYKRSEKAARKLPKSSGPKRKGVKYI